MDTKKIAQIGLASIATIGFISIAHIASKGNPHSTIKQSAIETRSDKIKQKIEEDPVIMTLSEIPEGKIDTSNIYIDADLLVDALNSSRLRRKDDYETQKQYDEYVDNYYKTVSFYKFNKDEMVVLAKDRVLSDVKYDPEKQQAYTRIDKYLWIKFETQPEGGYVGSNAFGASKVIEKEIQKRVRVEFKNYGRLKIKDHETGRYKWSSLHDETADIIIPMSSEKARNIVPKLDVVYLAKVIPPFIEYSSEHTKPTMDRPIDRRVSKYTIFSNLIAVLIINKDTGEIVTQKTF